jgi:cell division protein FtsB
LPRPAGLGRSGARLIALGLVALSLWLLASFVGQVITSAQMERRKEDLRAEIAQLEAGNAILKDRVAYAESPVYAERIAREQLGDAREGDTVILPTFPEQTAVPAAPSPVPLSIAPPAPNWHGWLRAFFPPAEAP